MNAWMPCCTYNTLPYEHIHTQNIHERICAYTHMHRHTPLVNFLYMSDMCLILLLRSWWWCDRQKAQRVWVGGREGGKWLCRINLCRPSSKIKHRQPLHLTSQIWKYSLRVRAKTQLWKYSLRVRAQQQRNYERFTSAFHINLRYCDVYFSKI